jgi:aryl-alcohol dehydrogenase-like predicted oxidoreductase
VSKFSSAKFWIGGNIFKYSLSEVESLVLLESFDSIGIRSVDTSSSYSMGASESIIGKWVFENKNRRSEFIISTKVGLQSGQSAAGLGKKTKILNSLHSSLDRLQTDYIDILFLHAPDPITDVRETVSIFLSLYSRSLIRGFGLCNASGVDVAKYLEIIEELGGDSKNFYIQNYFNWAKREEFYWDRLKGSSSQNDWNSVSYGVMGRGLFVPEIDKVDFNSRKLKSHSVNRDWENTNFLRSLRSVEELCEARDESLYSFSLAFSYYLSDYSIIAIRTLQQLEDFRFFTLNLMEESKFSSLLSEIRSLNLEFEVSLGDPNSPNRI